MNTFRAVRASVVLLLAAVGTAHAGMVGVSPPPGSEASHQQIIENLYGGSFTGSPATGYTGSGVSAGIGVARTEDFGNGGPRNADGSGPVTDDAVWTGTIISARAVGRFAGYNQKFGYFVGASGGSYTNLFDVTGSSYGVGGAVINADMLALAGGTWRWARGGNNGPHSSLPADNADSMDHMVSYRVSGLTNGAAATWLLFFEDLNQGSSDWDYNDLAVEVTVMPVPTPGAGALAACSALLMLRRRSKA